MPGFLRPLVELAPPWRPRRASAEADARPTASRAAVSGSCSAASSAFSSTTSTQPRRGCSRPRATRSSRRRASNAAARSHLHAGRRAEGHARAAPAGARHASGRRRAHRRQRGRLRLAPEGRRARPAGRGRVRAARRGRAARRAARARADASPSRTRATSSTPRACRPSRGSCSARFPASSSPSRPRAPICCGSAGIYNVVQPRAAAELGERKARHVAATGADVYASANPGCLVQVSSALRRAGQARPAAAPGRAPGRLDPRRPRRDAPPLGASLVGYPRLSTPGGEPP